jgi:menaquinone-specific isochorismate synthase
MPVEREPAVRHDIAARAEIDPGATAIAVPAPLGRAADLIAAWHGRPIAAWQGRDGESFVGLDVAASISHGPAVRVIARGGEILGRIRRATIAGAPATIDDLAALGIQPRLLGGFAFAPGAAATDAWRAFGDAWWFLPRLTYVRRGDRAWLVAIADPRVDRGAATFHADVARATDALARPRPTAAPPAIRVGDGDRARWIERVAAAVERIGDGALDKVVLARAVEIDAGRDFDLAGIVDVLDDRHPECTRFVFRPGFSCAFVGASPERLIARRGAQIASEGLAGSLPRTRDPGALIASAKDRSEHAIVVDAIARTLGPFCDALDVPATPEIRTLRHVHHLRTTVTGRLRAPAHVIELAAALHPTPAVGGWPTSAALAHLAAHEPEPRGWYAAPVGWFDGAGDGELTVAIRSALVDGALARAWAGAGIVADSDPAAEWDETQIKLRAMCGALGNADAASDLDSGRHVVAIVDDDRDDTLLELAPGVPTPAANDDTAVTEIDSARFLEGGRS